MTLTIIAKVDPFKLDANVHPTSFMHHLENDILNLMKKQNLLAASSIEVILDYDQGTEEATRRLFNIIKRFSIERNESQDDTGKDTGG